MVYKKDRWIETLKKAIIDTKHEGKPTAGLPCAIATIRYLRDGFLDDVGTPKDDADKALHESVRESFSELIKQIAKEGVSDGFGSNASAAAKSAGFKSQSVEVAELLD